MENVILKALLALRERERVYGLPYFLHAVNLRG